MSDADADGEASTQVARFRERYAAGAPFREDRGLAPELGLEASPVLSALATAIARGGDLSGPEHHEALAMVTLLGRRAGNLGATPTAALTLVPALAHALGPGGASLADGPLTALCMEGYVAGREERIREEAVQIARDAAPLGMLAERCAGLFLGGQLTAEAIAELVDRLGSLMLRSDAAAAVVDVGRLRSPDRERAAEVVAADGTARMLGARCVFVGLEPWLAELGPDALDRDLLLREPDLASGLRHALDLAGISLRAQRTLPGRLRAFLARGRHAR